MYADREGSRDLSTRKLTRLLGRVRSVRNDRRVSRAGRLHLNSWRRLLLGMWWDLIRLVIRQRSLSESRRNGRMTACHRAEDRHGAMRSLPCLLSRTSPPPLALRLLLNPLLLGLKAVRARSRCRPNFCRRHRVGLLPTRLVRRERALLS